MKTITRGLITITAACLAVNAFAQGSLREFSLEIERQPLAAALTEFSKQTGLQIGYFPETLTKNILIGPLSGHYTAEAAITKLLVPIGFSFERLNERTIAVTGPQPMRSQHRGFSKMELRLYHPTAPTFVRLSDVRLTEVHAAEEHDQQIRGAANARESADSKRRRGVLEEVIVTAQKREERLQDVPISISVLSGATLDKSTQSVTEELSRVPGVATLESTLGGGSLLSVRGVTAAGSNFAGSSPVGYYLDSVPFGLIRSAIAPDSNGYDLDRIEVLRGPQGTLYGASAQNGVVRVLTKDANLDDFELKMRAAGSETLDGGDNFRGDMALNAPIVSGKLAARAVIGYEDWSGWIDKPGRKDANDEEIRNLRLKVNAQPSENLSIGLATWISRAEGSSPAKGSEDRTHPSTIDEPLSADYDAYGLTIDYQFSDFSLSSSTSRIDNSSVSLVDYAAFFGPSVTGVHQRTAFDSEVFAEEINVRSKGEGVWRWSFGGMYRDAEDRFHQQVPVFFVNPNGTEYIDSSESYAVFGELTRQILEGRVELTGGLRYFEDEAGNRQLSHPQNPLATLVSSVDEFDAVSPRAVVTWHASDQTMVYASYSEGFRSGIPQSPTAKAAAPDLPGVDSDNLINYELGSKGSIWDGRLNFDAAVYYIDWQDIQQPLTVFLGPAAISALVNGQSASGVGVDFGLAISPASGLELGINYSWNDLAFDGDVISGTTTTFFEGDRLTNSPEHSAGAWADYAFLLGGGGYSGHFSISANYTSERQQRATVSGVSTVITSDDMLTSRLSFSVDAPGGWTASVFVDNLNDENGSPLVEVNPNFTQITSTRIRPRTVGVQVEYRL